MNGHFQRQPARQFRATTGLMQQRRASNLGRLTCPVLSHGWTVVTESFVEQLEARPPLAL